MRAIEVRDSSQVAVARREAGALAQAQDFDPGDVGRVALVATELATNLVKHGNGGTLLVGAFDHAGGDARGRTGIECLALDRGPGIVDVSAAMRDGHSTAGSPGTGLGAIARAAQVMEIYSRPGEGTAVLAQMTPDRRKPPADFGAVAVPFPGETVNGDGWCRSSWAGGWTVMLADGLGHGVDAAEASHAATRIFTRNSTGASTGTDRAAMPNDLLAEMHAALRPTRGAAVSIARLDAAAGEVLFSGVGNVAGALVAPDGGMRRMVANNGTIGHIAKHMKAFRYPIADASLLVMASDGLSTSWRMDAYPGLVSRHPTLVAGVLFRDCSRGRDDVTVLACRMGAT